MRQLGVDEWLVNAIMAARVITAVRLNGIECTDLEVKAGVHEDLC